MVKSKAAQQQSRTISTHALFRGAKYISWSEAVQKCDEGKPKTGIGRVGFHALVLVEGTWEAPKQSKPTNWREAETGQFRALPKAPGAFNGRQTKTLHSTPRESVFGGLKTWLLEGPKFTGSLWDMKKQVAARFSFDCER